MNDITTSSPSAAPPSSAPTPSAPAPSTPSTPPLEPASQEMLDQLSAPDDISQYVQERRQAEGQSEQQESEPKKRRNRYERLRRARDAAQAEAASLREQSAPAVPSPSDDGATDAQADDGQQAQPPETYQATPEERAEAHEQLKHQMARDADVRADYRARERQVAAHLPNYREVLASVNDVDLPDHVCDLIRASPVGPVIAYQLAASVDGLQALHVLKDMNPIAAAQAIARHEAQIEYGMRQRLAAPPQQQGQQQQHRRVTQARAPIKPLRGSGGPSPSLAGLASSDDISSYAQTRLRQMKADKSRPR